MTVTVLFAMCCEEVFNKAIQGYVNDTKKNIPNLMRYAKELRVQKRVWDFFYSVPQ